MGLSFRISEHGGWRYEIFERMFPNHFLHKFSFLKIVVGGNMGLKGFTKKWEILREESDLIIWIIYITADQQLALQWVQETIHSFNGDSHRVTIFGVRT